MLNSHDLPDGVKILTMGDNDDYYYGSISDDLEDSEYYDEENASEFRVLGAGRFQMVVDNPEEMRDLWR